MIRGFSSFTKSIDRSLWLTTQFGHISASRPPPRSCCCFFCLVELIFIKTSIAAQWDTTNCNLVPVNRFRLPTTTSTSGRQTDSDTHKSIFGDSFIANISSDIELDDMARTYFNMLCMGECSLWRQWNEALHNWLLTAVQRNRDSQRYQCHYQPFQIWPSNHKNNCKNWKPFDYIVKELF